MKWFLQYLFKNLESAFNLLSEVFTIESAYVIKKISFCDQLGSVIPWSLFSNRSKTPLILNSDGESFYGEGYEFTPGVDEIIRDGDAGWIVSYGDMLHRCLHVVEEYRENGVNIGLINKPSLSSVDEDTMEKIGKSPFGLVVEILNSRTGLGVRFGTWLLERGFAPNYDYMGTTRPGNCGQEEQILHQGLGIDGLREKLSSFL